MLIQPNNYHGLLKDYAMTNEEKNDFIHIIARIMESFVDRAFGIDSVQLVTACKNRIVSQETRENVKLNASTLTNHFNAVAANT